MKRNNLKKFRKMLGFSQVELAQRTHCSRVTIIFIERLGHYPTVGVRSRLATALGVHESVIWPTLEVVANGREG